MLCFICDAQLKFLVQNCYQFQEVLSCHSAFAPAQLALLYLRGLPMAYYCVNNLASTCLWDKFRKRSTIHNLATRTRDTLEIAVFKTATGQRTLIYRAVNTWNNSDDNLKACSSLRLFKT